MEVISGFSYVTSQEILLTLLLPSHQNFIFVLLPYISMKYFLKSSIRLPENLLLNAAPLSVGRLEGA
jgi:hypothetical protein